MRGVSVLRMRVSGRSGIETCNYYLYVLSCGHWIGSSNTMSTYGAEVAYMGSHTCGLCNATGQVWKCGNKGISEHYHCDCGSDHILESSKIW